MLWFKARFYGYQVPVIGVDANACFEFGQLKIKTATGDLITVKLDDIYPSSAGFSHDQLFLNWTDSDNKSLALSPLEKIDENQLISSYPVSLKERLEPLLKKRNSLKIFYLSIILIITMLLLLIFLVF